MNILLTPALTQFLVDQGYNYCIISNARPGLTFTTITPIQTKPSLEQLDNGCDAILTTANLQYLVDEMNENYILVNVDTHTLLAYIGSLMRATVKKPLYN